MRIKDAEHYQCTTCENHFCIAEERLDASGDIIDGMLLCSSCGKQHRILKGIPRFVPAENYADSFGYQWNIHRRTQLDSYTGLPISRQRLFSVSGWPDSLSGQFVLEAGSGAGRFTEVLLSSGADVFSFDYSTAVEANLENNVTQPNLHLFQGDIFNIPFPEASFDKVICLGVLQHTPCPERAFKCLANFVRPGGEIVIDIYRASMAAYLQWKYLLRPITKRMKKDKLYKMIAAITPRLVPISATLRRVIGRAGARVVPIVEYSHLGLSPEINKEWAILDTFDMYSPVHDHPQKMSTVSRWFIEEGLTDIKVSYGPNGIVGKCKRPGPRAITRQ